jgi:hypothetical protein
MSDNMLSSVGHDEKPQRTVLAGQARVIKSVAYAKCADYPGSIEHEDALDE